MNNNNIFTYLLRRLGVRYTKKYSSKLYNEHPNKYNMLGLSEMFSHYKIDNRGVKINDKNQIALLETPFIAHMGSDFVAVNNVSKEHVRYIWNEKKITITLEEFLKSWSGIILLAEANIQSSEPNYKENKKQEIFEKTLNILLSLSIIVFTAVYFITNGIAHHIGLILLTMLNIIGIYIGYLLVLKQLHVQSDHADKLCSLFSKSDCNNVLESSAAKFLGIIGWSELGLSYFISNISVLLFIPSLLPYLVLLNICALPYSFWSVWYQKFKAKQWCPLCLIVQVLFWAIFFINWGFNFITLPNFSIYNVLIVGSIYSMPFLIISILLPNLGERKKAERITQEFNSFKMDQEVFTAILSKQPHYNVDKNTSNILFGNPKSSTLVTILTNPHCAPCARMHKRMESILEKAGDKICIQYILSSFGEELNVSNKYLIGVYKQRSTDDMMTIYDKWFSEGKNDKENFFSLYKIDLEDADIEREFEQHTEWKDITQIRATPTILVNGYKLPDNYKIEDLVYFAD